MDIRKFYRKNPNSSGQTNLLNFFATFLRELFSNEIRNFNISKRVSSINLFSNGEMIARPVPRPKTRLLAQNRSSKE